jgi:chromosome segregation ATPase
MNSTTEVTDMIEKLHGWLNDVRDTFINASTLAETVRTLQVQVDQMKADVEHLRQVNATLDETIVRIRQERDNAQAEAQTYSDRLRALDSDFNSVKSERDSLKAEMERLQALVERERAKHYEELDQSKRAHDDAEYRAMHWEEQHNAVKSQLQRVKDAIGGGDSTESNVTPFSQAANQ